MDIKKDHKNGCWMATKQGQINGIDYCFFAQSSSLQKAAKTVLEAFAEFKKQVKVFDQREVTMNEEKTQIADGAASALIAELDTGDL